MARCVLIFGGTFDPPHRAHTALPPLVAKQLGCERIIYVPAAINPLKADHPPTPAHHRLKMLRLALRELPNAEISTIELDRPGPSYTVDTLKALKESLGADLELRLLIGADQAIEFPRWKDWRRILELATPVVVLRPPWTAATFATALDAAHGPAEAPRWQRWIVPAPIIDLSATEIREHLRGGQSDPTLINPDVAAYARQHGLYA